MAVETETCANCDATIGRLETAHLWHDQVVCGKCIKILRSQEGDKGSSKLNKRQWIALLVGCVLVMLSCIFPPVRWFDSSQEHFRWHYGYRLFFLMQQTRVQWNLFFFQFLSIVTGTGTLLVLFSDSIGAIVCAKWRAWRARG